MIGRVSAMSRLWSGRGKYLTGSAVLGVLVLAAIAFLINRGGGDPDATVRLSGTDGISQETVLSKTGFSPAVVSALEDFSTCMESLYRDNLQRNSDFDHGAAADRYVENWSVVLSALDEPSRLEAINRELITYDCAPVSVPARTNE